MKKSKLGHLIITLIAKVKIEDKRKRYAAYGILGLLAAASTQIDSETQQVIFNVLEQLF